MGALIVRLTVVTAVAAALLSGMLAAATHASWTAVMFRALIALVLVLAVCFGFGQILMRTALRRHYEQAQASRRARGNR